jgi:hypothetical protein
MHAPYDSAMQNRKSSITNGTIRIECSKFTISIFYSAPLLRRCLIPGMRSRLRPRFTPPPFIRCPFARHKATSTKSDCLDGPLICRHPFRSPCTRLPGYDRGMDERSTPGARGQKDYAWIMLIIALVSLALNPTFGPWSLLTFAVSSGSFVILMVLRRINQDTKRPPDDP